MPWWLREASSSSWRGHRGGQLETASSVDRRKASRVVLDDSGPVRQRVELIVNVGEMAGP